MTYYYDPLQSGGGHAHGKQFMTTPPWSRLAQGPNPHSAGDGNFRLSGHETPVHRRVMAGTLRRTLAERMKHSSPGSLGAHMTETRQR